MNALQTNTDYFGIDIGVSGLRAVQLRKGTALPALVTYGAAPLAPGLIESDAPVDQETVANAIKDLLSQARITSKQVVVGLSSTHAFTTIIKTPKLTEAEIGKAIKLQADQYIPMPIDQVKLDWHIMGNTADGKEVEVMLVSAPTTVVDKYLNIVELAGLELLAIETNAIAVSRSLVTDAEVPVMIVDIGNASTEVTVVHNKIPRLVRSIPVGGATFLRSVVQNLNLDEAQAQQFMQKFGLTQTKLEGQVLKAMKSSLDSLLSEVTKSIKFYSSQSNLKLEKIILTGSSAALPEFGAYVANSLSLPVTIGNPWVNVSYASNLQDSLMEHALRFGVAVGLAQRAFL